MCHSHHHHRTPCTMDKSSLSCVVNYKKHTWLVASVISQSGQRWSHLLRRKSHTANMLGIAETTKNTGKNSCFKLKRVLFTQFGSWASINSWAFSLRQPLSKALSHFLQVTWLMALGKLHTWHMEHRPHCTPPSFVKATILFGSLQKGWNGSQHVRQNTSSSTPADPQRKHNQSRSDSWDTITAWKWVKNNKNVNIKTL